MLAMTISGRWRMIWMYVLWLGTFAEREFVFSNASLHANTHKEHFLRMEASLSSINRCTLRRPVRTFHLSFFSGFFSAVKR